MKTQNGYLPYFTQDNPLFYNVLKFSSSLLLRSGSLKREDMSLTFAQRQPYSTLNIIQVCSFSTICRQWIEIYLHLMSVCLNSVYFYFLFLVVVIQKFLFLANVEKSIYYFLQEWRCLRGRNSYSHIVHQKLFS